jgi:transcriptional regulator of heat shock response
MNFRYYEIPDDRELRVLESVVRLHTESADPVSSAAVARDLDHRWSSATIRNVFSELEQRGWLYRPHASSGRVPTERGYRVYVESVVLPGRREGQGRRLLESELDLSPDAGAEQLQEAMKLISQLSHALGISLLVLAPEGRDSADCRLTGVNELLEQPEFEDPEHLRGLIQVIQGPGPLGEYLRGEVAGDPPLKVLIGRENRLEILSPFSLVATRVEGEKRSALLGVLGPHRMEYPLAIEVLAGLSQLLEGWPDDPRRWS